MLLDGRRVHVDGDAALAEGLADHGASLVSDDGPLDAFVHVMRVSAEERDLVDTDPAMWMSAADEPLAAAIAAAQRAHARLRRPGRLVFVVPSFGITGAAGRVAAATAAEGVRSLAKSAARQWGGEGVTVACVARSMGGPEVATSSLPPATLDEVAATVALLCSEQAGALTGTTVVVDGGTVLTP